jgi:hypothetical protein
MASHIEDVLRKRPLDEAQQKIQIAVPHARQCLRPCGFLQRDWGQFYGKHIGERGQLL